MRCPRRGGRHIISLRSVGLAGSGVLASVSQIFRQAPAHQQSPTADKGGPESFHEFVSPRGSLCGPTGGGLSGKVQNP